MVLCAAWCACSPSGQEALRARPGQQDPAIRDGGACSAAEADEGPLPEPAAPEPDPKLASARHQYFAIRVLDAQTQEPIAGARVETLNHVVYTSDNLGQIAFYEPGLMDEDLFFQATRPGYEQALDALNFRGRVLHAVEGAMGELTMQATGDAIPSIDAGLAETSLLARSVPTPGECFAIRAIDRETRRGVPLVFLHGEHASLVSDSQGMMAYCPPAPLGGTVRFEVTSHGYTFPAGWVALPALPGQGATLELTRSQLAQRLVRTTGQGIYHDSLLLGLKTPLASPALSARVIAQDSVASAVYHGQVFYTWGTTDRASHPLGNFQSTGATSPLPASLPASGLDYTYFVDSAGFARPITDHIEPTSQPTWLPWIAVVPNSKEQEQLFAAFVKPNANLSVLRRGLARFDDATGHFVDTGFALEASDLTPLGQPLSVEESTQAHLYFSEAQRVPAAASALTSAASYERWTALASEGKLERDAQGKLVYRWRSRGLPVTSELLNSQGVDARQGIEKQLRDTETSVAIVTTGAPAQRYSERRQRFVRLVQQQGGSSSFLGEIWYAEADTPMGPWVYARKVVSHDAYSFYGPWFFPDTTGSQRTYLFEGSYSPLLAGNVEITPRYSRNQIMYALDLDDPRLALPVPVYDRNGQGEFVTKRMLSRDEIPRSPAFFAPEQPAPGSLAVGWSGPSCAARKLVVGDPPTRPLFHVLPPAQTPSSGMIPLYELPGDDGSFRYALAAPQDAQATSIGYVWASPIDVAFPVSEYLGPIHAEAGVDQCLSVVDPAAQAQVMLDGSSSFTLSGDITTYHWRDAESGCALAHGKTAPVTLGPGLHELELKVKDSRGRSHVDTLLVLVSAPGVAL